MMPESQATLQVHDFLADSRSNGPGRRAVLWLQGCSLACPGCFNPQTHSRSGGVSLAVDDLSKRILRLGAGIDGLTLSGGEPFQQPQGVCALVEKIRRQSQLSVVVFSGFTWEEIQRIPAARTALDWIDVLIAGRYREEERLAQGLLGSRNKKMIFLTDRYQPADFAGVATTEVTIGPAGEIWSSGIDPLQMQ